MLYAALLAGGIGSRMNSDMPKQFLPVRGRPILTRSIERFQTLPFDRIYVVCVAQWLEHTEKLLKPFCENDDRIRLIVGGSDRMGSILCALRDIEGELSGREVSESALLASPSPLCSNDIIVTHDAVRPFVTKECIAAVCDAALCGCAGCAVPVTDTILQSADGANVDSIPPRIGLYRAQTPQAFLIGRFLRRLSSLSERQRAALTDACGVFVAAGETVRIIAGDERNIKITTPVDLMLAEQIASTLD